MNASLRAQDVRAKAARNMVDFVHRGGQFPPEALVVGRLAEDTVASALTMADVRIGVQDPRLQSPEEKRLRWMVGQILHGSDATINRHAQ